MIPQALQQTDYMAYRYTTATTAVIKKNKRCRQQLHQRERKKQEAEQQIEYELEQE